MDLLKNDQTTITVGEHCQVETAANKVLPELLGKFSLKTFPLFDFSPKPISKDIFLEMIKKSSFKHSHPNYIPHGNYGHYTIVFTKEAAFGIGGSGGIIIIVIVVVCFLKNCRNKSTNLSDI